MRILFQVGALELGHFRRFLIQTRRAHNPHEGCPNEHRHVVMLERIAHSLEQSGQPRIGPAPRAVQLEGADLAWMVDGQLLCHGRSERQTGDVRALYLEGVEQTSPSSARRRMVYCLGSRGWSD